MVKKKLARKERRLLAKKALRLKKKAITGQALLIDFLWTKFGGPTAVAKKLGVPQQTPANWRLRGKVPLEKTGLVARKLKISPWGLNYLGLKGVNGKAPSWKEVVKSYKLPRQATEKILFLKPPE